MTSTIATTVIDRVHGDHVNEHTIEAIGDQSGSVHAGSPVRRATGTIAAASLI